MFLVHPDGIIDFDLDLLADVFAQLDKRLEQIFLESAASPDPDSYGYFDRAEYVSGLGFVACQAYLASTYGFLRVQKTKALAVGPVHQSGRTVVMIVNHAANYWKHHEEWVLDSNDAKRNRVAAAFEEVGFPVDSDYPLCGILSELVAPSAIKFAALLPVLARWRDELHKTAA